MDEWRRPLGPAAYARGVSTCLENARNLIDDALVLLEANRTARAVALVILALEEGDKVKRLLRMALMTDPPDIEREWAAFRDHKPKLTSALSLLTHGQVSILSDKLASKKLPPPLVAWVSDLPRLAERLKVRCLYVTRLRDGTWSAPSRVVPRVMAQAIIAAALLSFTMTTALALSAEMLVGGQIKESPGFERPDFSKATPRAKRWLRWRLGKAGKKWAERELSRQMRWVGDAEQRHRRLSTRPATRQRGKPSVK